MKAQKKAEKEKSTIEKKKAKKASPKKRGRTAAEKAEPWAKKAKKPTKGARASSSWEGTAASSRKMRRLKRMASKTNPQAPSASGAEDGEIDEHRASEQTHEVDGKTTPDPKKMAKRAKNGKRAATKESAKEAQTELKEASTKEVEPKAEAEAPKPGRKTAAKSKPKAKAKHEKKETSAPKAPKGKKPKKEKERKKGPKEPSQQHDQPRTKTTKRAAESIAPDPECKDEVALILKEYDRTHCTHPDFSRIKCDNVDVQPYKTRMACGVKVDRKFFTCRKAKGEGKAHVTYFSCPTTCPYSNMTLGALWASRLQEVYINTWPWPYSCALVPALNSFTIPVSMFELESKTCFIQQCFSRWKLLLFPKQLIHPNRPPAKVKEWERMGRPDPVGDHMRGYADRLKSSHVAAVAEHKPAESG